MRIAELLSVGIANGAARHCLALSEQLARRGHEVLLLHRRHLDVANAEAAGVKCLEFAFDPSLNALRDTVRLLREHEIEVVHTHMSAAHGYGVLLRFAGGPRTVATAHARHLQLHWPFNDIVIAPSETTARYHRRVNLVRAGNLRVIPSFLGAQRFHPPTRAQRRAAREALGVAPDALVIGQVGDVHFDKRQSDLVQAARRLFPDHPQILVALLGARYERSERSRLARARRGVEARVRLVDRGADVARFLHALDIFAISSVREEGPMVALEAMSVGLPIVSTRVGRMEALTGRGVAGLIVEPRDLAGMADALRTLVNDPERRAELGVAAARRAVAERDTTAAVDAIEAALAEVAAWASRRRPQIIQAQDRLRAPKSRGQKAT